jgi:hypothetical protein
MDGAPGWNGITFVADGVADPPHPVGDAMTWPAVIVVPLTVPRTSTLSPFLTALAEIELVPLRYVVEDALLTVTFWPADVEIVKLDLDTLSTVPDAPPAAGPDRALDPPPPGTSRPDVGAGEVAVAAVPEPLFAVEVTMPYAPPAIAMATAPTTMGPVSLRKNMD